MRGERDDAAIDAAIAAAAQALTSAAPSAALRAGVRDRIGGRGLVASALRRKNLRWLVPAAAAAAVVVVALILGRLTSQPPGAPGNQPRPSAPVLVTAPAPQPNPGPVVETATVASPPVRRLAAAFEPPIEEVEPLIPPITIPPLETELIVVDASSGVMPIEIEPLRIEPLQGE